MNPILFDIPVPIETKHLHIRPPLSGDGQELNAAISESFTELHKWMPWAQVMPTIDQSEEYVRRSHAQWILRQNLCLFIFDKDTGRLAGSSGLHRANWDLPSFEIGYWVRNQFSRRGYITESTAAITQFAFAALHAKRVEIRCDSDNIRSAAIPKRLGFDHEATLRCTSVKPSGTGLRDTEVFARLNLIGLPDVAAKW